MIVFDLQLTRTTNKLCQNSVATRRSFLQEVSDAKHVQLQPVKDIFLIRKVF